jgi:hypothetical protein
MSAYTLLYVSASASPAVLQWLQELLQDPTFNPLDSAHKQAAAAAWASILLPDPAGASATEADVKSLLEAEQDVRRHYGLLQLSLSDRIAFRAAAQRLTQADEGDMDRQLMRRLLVERFWAAYEVGSRAWSQCLSDFGADRSARWPLVHGAGLRPCA